MRPGDGEWTPGLSSRDPTTTLRTLGLTAAAMTVFAANSLLCRAALGRGLVDASTFTSVRLLSGAADALTPRPPSRRDTTGTRDLRAAASLFVYAFAFSLAYTRIPAGLGALLLFGAVQVTMVGRGLAAGERPGAPGVGRDSCSRSGAWSRSRFRALRPRRPAGSILMIGAGIAWGVYSLLGSLEPRRPARGERDPLRVRRAAGPRREPRRGRPRRAAALCPGSRPRGRVGRARLGARLRRSGTRRCVVSRRRRPRSSSSRRPPLAALGGVLLLGESVTLRLALSALAILGGIALAATSRRAPGT